MRSDIVPFQLAFGCMPFEYFGGHDEAGARFLSAISASRGRQTLVDGLAAIPELVRSRLIVDVGGGDGQTLIEALIAAPEAAGQICDLGYVRPRAEQRIAELGVSGRATFVECDFFQKIPAGGDMYLLSRILHDWNDQRARLILGNCRQAMSGKGHLLIFEKLLPLSFECEHLEVAMNDLNVFVMCGGKERTLNDFKTVLAWEGFEVVSVHQLMGDFCAILAVLSVSW